MPCDCSHMQPTYDETESKRVCKLICFLFNELNLQIPNWIEEASIDMYGNSRKLTAAESILYDTVKSLSEDKFSAYVYNARSKDSRKLANWYEDYDKKTKDKREGLRIKAEKEKRAKSILAKLRNDDVEIIRNYLKNS